jgi:hypothetical protein
VGIDSGWPAAIRLALIFLAALVMLGHGAHTVRVTAEFSDPVSGIRAQDEAVYTHCALRMATQGGWLTPVFLSRYILYKPPLAAWLSGLSLKAFGISLLSLRVPELLAGALAAPLLFLWARRLHPGALLPGVAAVLLLLSNRVWHVFSRVCQTDILVAASIVGALTCFALDTRLERRWAQAGFAIGTAAAVLSKSVAGLIPLLVLALSFAWLAREDRPKPGRVVRVTLLAAAIAAPWHLYQIVVHPQWFWAEYVQLQLLGFGVRPPTQISAENPLGFYAVRLFATDPGLCLLLLASLPSLGIALRRAKNPPAVVLLAWLCVSAGALLLFQYRNLQYAASLVPALCLAAGAYFPTTSRSGRTTLVAVLCLMWGVKMWFAERPWGLPHREIRPFHAADALRDYAERNRPNGLILAAADDDFYAAVLPLPRVRYFFHDPENRTGNYAPYFQQLGVTVRAAEFLDMEQLRRTYAGRLREWGLASTEPLATSIVANEPSELAGVVRAHPAADYYIPAGWRDIVMPAAASTHDVVETAGRLLLLARRTPRAPPRLAAWTLPEFW